MINYSNPLKFENIHLYAADHVHTKHLDFTNDGLLRIVCVTSGSFTFTKGNFHRSAQMNDCIFLYPGSNRDLTGKEEFELDVIAFSINSGKYTGRFSNELFAQLNDNSFIFPDKSVCVTVSNICKEIQNGESIFSKELVSLLCNELIVYLLRHFNDKQENSKDSEDNSTANEKLCSRVMQYIDNRIFMVKNLNEVASAMGYNYSYISTLFHKTTGMTLNNYFKQKRMDTAKLLLSDSKMSISEIARTMNYSSVYAFSKAFKEHFGSSPGHYSGRFSGKEI